MINEAFKLSKGKDRRGNIVAYLDPNKPENKDTFAHKDIFKKYGAKWNNENKFWYWYVGKTEDQWRNVFEKND